MSQPPVGWWCDHCKFKTVIASEAENHALTAHHNVRQKQLFDMSKGLVEQVECNKCHYKVNYQWDGRQETYKDAWDLFPGGCPKCGNATADVTIVA